MPQPKPIPVPPAPTARTSKPVRVFSVGQTLPSGRVADEPFLDAVVANWQAYQAKGDPRFPKPPAYLIPAASVSIGHEPNSSIARAYAERSDLPAVGWPDRVWRDGRFLMAELRGIPAGLASFIEAGFYGERSAEFYEDYQGYGPTLRRVSMLGADVPACKDLGPMPTLVFDPELEATPNPLAFSERLADFARANRGGFAVGLGGVGLVTFSESTPAPEPEKPPMTPAQQALFDALAAAGMDTSKLDGAALDGILAKCQPAAPTVVPPVVPPVATNSDDPDTDKDKDGMPATFSEKQLKALQPFLTAAVAAAVTPLQKEIGDLKATSGQSAAELAANRQAADRAAVAAFCETHKDRIFPYELDPARGPTLVDQLLALPAAAVATFAEGKVSPRQALMNQIAARPPAAKFRELIAQPLNQDPATSTKAQILAGSELGRAVLARQQAAAKK